MSTGSRTVDTVVLDVDGTLVDTAPDLAAAANHVFEQIGLAPIPPQALHPFISRGSRAMIEAGLRLHGVGKPEAEVTRLHELFFPYYAANVAALSRPFEGVPDVLDALLKKGARLAVCTNKFEALSRSLLEQLGLASFRLEGLGIWLLETGPRLTIKQSQWNGLNTTSPPSTGRTAVGVKFTNDGRRVAAALARKGGAVGFGVTTGIYKREAWLAQPAARRPHRLMSSVGELLELGIIA